MSEIAIEVKNVKVVYKLNQKFSIQRNLIRRDAEKAKVYEAVKDVSFSLKKEKYLASLVKTEVENQHCCGRLQECSDQMKVQ